MGEEKPLFTPDELERIHRGVELAAGYVINGKKVGIALVSVYEKDTDQYKQLVIEVKFGGTSVKQFEAWGG